MRNWRLYIRSGILFSVCGLLTGCAVFGIVRRVPMLEVKNEAVAVSAATDLTPIIVRAAIARRWTAKETAPGVVRCRFDAHSWSIDVDVRHSGSSFSIDYVDSNGLFYRQDLGDIHRSYNKQVEALRRRIHREAQVLRPGLVATSVSTSMAAAPAVAAKPYTIESFAREAGNGFSYKFVFKLNDASTADMMLSRRIQDDVLESVRKDYVAAFATKDTSSLRIEFPEYAIRDGKVMGRATVIAVELLEFVYDPETAHGRLAVKVNPQQYEITRQWVRNNIATLAKDKSAKILSSLSKTPRFTIGREVLRDDNVLEVEFQAGE